MTNVKVVQQTNKPTDRAKTICPRYHYRGHKKVPPLQGIDILAVNETLWKMFLSHLSIRSFLKGENSLNTEEANWKSPKLLPFVKVAKIHVYQMCPFP